MYNSHYIINVAKIITTVVGSKYITVFIGYVCFNAPSNIQNEILKWVLSQQQYTSGSDVTIPDKHDHLRSTYLFVTNGEHSFQDTFILKNFTAIVNFPLFSFLHPIIMLHNS